MAERRRRAAPLAALLCAAACGFEADPVAVSFERLGHVETVQEPQLFFERGALVVAGMFHTPCEPYTALARADVRTGAVRVVITRSALACPLAASGNFAWRAVLTNLPAGDYEVRSIHEYSSAGWPSDSATIGLALVP